MEHNMENAQHCTKNKNTWNEQLCQINANKNASTSLMFVLLCFLDYIVLVPPGGSDMNGASPPLGPVRAQ